MSQVIDSLGDECHRALFIWETLHTPEVSLIICVLPLLITYDAFQQNYSTILFLLLLSV